jgi:RNA polymerase sigma-70 factor (ECF subfamily)
VTRNHQQVLRSAIDGDAEALTQLVRAHHDRIYRFGVRVCRDPMDAEDAVQEAFVKLSKRPDVQRHPGVLGWLLSVVRTTCIHLLRPFSRERSRLGAPIEDAETIPSADLSPEQAIQRWELIQRVHAAVADLERPYREVIILRDLEGLSGAEVCSALGLTEAGMKSRLHRARALLREQVLDLADSDRQVN